MKRSIPILYLHIISVKCFKYQRIGLRFSKKRVKKRWQDLAIEGVEDETLTVEKMIKLSLFKKYRIRKFYETKVSFKVK